jgi:hypothetical protein
VSVRRVGTAFVLTARDLLRRRVVLLMLLVVPSVFLGLTHLTTSSDPLSFLLPSLGEGRFVVVAQRAEAMVFVALAAVGALTAFLALGLGQRDAEASWRLVLCGYRPAELVAARLALLLATVLLVSAWVALLLRLAFAPERAGAMLLGLALCGWVYAGYGLLVGALFRQELEGVLFIVLLVNVDVGWLQNPLYYTYAQHRALIRALPGYFPSQVGVIGAFTAYDPRGPALWALVYGAGLAAAALLVFAWRYRGRR